MLGKQCMTKPKACSIEKVAENKEETNGPKGGLTRG